MQKPDDFDIVTISSKKMHNKFINHFKKLLRENKLKPIIFTTIKKKPKIYRKDEILIHDLHYENFGQLEKREWKSVINTMKKEMIILHGDKKT